MNREEFVTTIRQEIRENGFMSEVQLAMLITKRALEFGVQTGRVDDLLKQIICDDILTIEYGTWLTREYRVKQLYYFKPLNDSE